MGKRLALLLVVVLLASFVLGACGPLGELGPLGDTGDAFLTALKNGDWAASFNMLGSDLQQEVGGLEAWADGWAQVERPESWSFSSRRVENSTGYLEGTMTWNNGEASKCNLVLFKLGDAWKIVGYDFSQ